MKIVLDPGHGGFDPGAVGNGMNEADLALQISLVVARELIAGGHKVVMTRTTSAAPNNARNKSAELKARVNIANASKADIFASVHINAGGGDGAEVLVYQKDNQIMPFANSVLANLVPLMGQHGSEGIKIRKDLYVLANTTMPAMLIEVGYIDGRGDDPEVMRAHAEEIGKRVAAGLMKKSYQEVKAMGNVNQTVPEWAEKAWAWTQNVGPKVGEPLMDGTRPNNQLTRAEFATVLERFYRTIKKEMLADRGALEKQVAELKK